MKIDMVSGLLEGAYFIASPNHDLRPADIVVDVLIIHAISLPPGQFDGDAIAHLFCNKLDPTEHPFYQEIKDLKVSAHLLIRRDGNLLQFVPFHLRAWHAGQSCCEGRTRVNDFSIGIELEGTDDIEFTERQYRTLADVTKTIMVYYPQINTKRIFGHSDIAPGRKTDPGPCFNWEYYLALCQ